MLFRRLSTSRLVTIAQIEGRVRGAGSEFILACDLRFAARESAMFGQPETGFGVIPGAGGIQHLARLLGRARALEVILSAEDYDADLAERYGWDQPGRWPPVRSAASSGHSRIESPPCRLLGRAVVKDRINPLALAPADEFRSDSDLFVECARGPETQHWGAAMTRGFQTHDGELALVRMVGRLGRPLIQEGSRTDDTFCL
jgi:hypothetical protein